MLENCNIKESGINAISLLLKFVPSSEQSSLLAEQLFCK